MLLFGVNKSTKFYTDFVSIWTTEILNLRIFKFFFQQFSRQICFQGLFKKAVFLNAFSCLCEPWYYKHIENIAFTQNFDSPLYRLVPEI